MITKKQIADVIRRLKQWKPEPTPYINYYTLMQANNPVYMKLISESQRQAMIEHGRRMNPEDCSCCLFFTWTFEGNKISGSRCTVSDVQPREAFDHRPEGCPLNKEEENDGQHIR